MDETRPSIHERDTERAKLAAALPAYEIGAILGRGAFAVVYAARHRHLEREVAIKRLSPELLREAEARGRFAAEARLLASLDHPHIVRVHDYVEEEDVCAFVMERMTGGTLADRMAAGVQREWACAVMLGALHGLEHAHRKGVLHRDIKPENLLFDAGSQVKVADFGIAKVVGAQGARLTATAAAIGTPAYMAPEQVTRNAGPLSSATDVWSAAAVLYEMVAGEPPYPLTGELADVLIQRWTDEPRPLLEVAPDTPAPLAEVVMRALAPAPGDRYPTPGAFAAALEPVAGRLADTGVPIHRTAPRPGEPELLLETQPVPPKPKTRSRRRRPLIFAAAAAALVAVAAVLVLVIGGSDPGTADALPPPPKLWPPKLTAAFIDQKDGAPGTAERLGKGGTTYNVFYGDAGPRKDWSHAPEQGEPSAFIGPVSHAGLYPYLSFYSLRVLGTTKSGGEGNAPELRKTLGDQRLMHTYWLNVKKFLVDVGSTKKAAAISLDSNFWSFLEQDLANNGERPTSIGARVGLSGVPELKGIADNLPGIAEGWRALRDKYAKRAALGYQFDDWAANGLVDIDRDNPATATVVDAARQAGEVFSAVAATQLDFAALTVNGNGQQEGQNTSAKNNYSTVEKDKLATFVREFVRTADTPVVLEGVPLGNTVYRTIDDRSFHWRDSWVQWLIGDKDFSGLREFHDAGVIGVLFGTGYGEGETCPCDAAADKVTNKGPNDRKVSSPPDDDVGSFAERMKALNKAGGMPLAEPEG